MKTNSPSGRGLLRLPIVMAIVTVMPLLAARAADDGISKDHSESTARITPEKMITNMLDGTWKNTERNMSMKSMTFSEPGGFAFEREQNGETKMERGLYSVKANGDGLIVSVFISQGKTYFSMTPISSDRAAWQELKSPTDKPDPSKAVVWTRGDGAPGAETSAAPPNVTGKELLALQTPANLIGKWKGTASDGRVDTMIFSKSGEFHFVEAKGDGLKADSGKLTYTAQAVDGGLLVTLNNEVEEKVYFGMAFLSKDRCFRQVLESPTDRIDPDKPSNILTRIP